MTENQQQTTGVTAEIQNNYGDSLCVESTRQGVSLAIHPFRDQGLAWHPKDRLQALEVAALIVEADIDQHPTGATDDGRELAVSFVRGFITDTRDAADDAHVAAFYEGQHAAEGRQPVVGFHALPAEDKRTWRAKRTAALKSITPNGA